MRIKSIVAAAAIALIAGVGSVSADELSEADTKGNPFAMLEGIETSQMSVQDMAATHGAASVGGSTRQLSLDFASGGTVSSSGGGGWHMHIFLAGDVTGDFE